MRMLRIALVLLVLASFVVANVAVSMAATDTPKTPKAPKTTVKVPNMPAGAKMPTKKPGQMINLGQMQSNIGNVYKMLKETLKMPGGKMNVPGAGVKSKASEIMSGTSGKMTQGQPLLRGVPAPQTISKRAGMPQLGKMVKIL